MMTGRCRNNTVPIKVTDTPMTVKTVVKPATKNDDARNVTRRASRSPSSETGSADT